MIPHWIKHMLHRADCSASVARLQQAREDFDRSGQNLLRAALDDVSRSSPDTSTAEADDKIFNAIDGLRLEYRRARRRDP